jgi:S1-C subfamily serine protease
MSHSAGKFLLFLSVILTSCATVHPSPHNLTAIAGKVGNEYFSGSAFLYRGRVVTAGHVCAAAHSIGETLELSFLVRNTVYTAGLWEPDAYVFDGAQDACLLKRVKGAPVANLGLQELQRGEDPKPGDAVSIVGAPWGYTMFRTDGYAAGTEGMQGYLGVSAAAAPGNSGGPVVDSQGRLIGILAAGLRAYEHISLATPVAVLDRLIDANPN